MFSCFPHDEGTAHRIENCHKRGVETQTASKKGKLNFEAVLAYKVFATFNMKVNHRDASVDRFPNQTAAIKFCDLKYALAQSNCVVKNGQQITRQKALCLPEVRIKNCFRSFPAFQEHILPV